VFGATATIVALLSFAGCTGFVRVGIRTDVTLTLSWDPAHTVNRVVFVLTRPRSADDDREDHDTVLTIVVIHPNLLRISDASVTAVLDAFDKTEGTCAVRLPSYTFADPEPEWRVICRAFVDPVKDDECYPEAETLVENRAGLPSETAAKPFAFEFEIREREPLQTFGLPKDGQQTAPRPDVFLEFDRDPEVAQVLAVSFRVDVTVGVAPLTQTYHIDETVSDMETHATHAGNPTWKTVFAVTFDEAGSNATGQYRMSIRNAPEGDWSVICDGYDVANPGKATPAKYPAGLDPVNPSPHKKTIVAGYPQPTTFKFQLKSGTGAGTVIVPA